MSKHVRFITLGCKVNQYETQAMREQLAECDIVELAKTATDNENVDFVVVNTCTVTHAADRENKYWIRRARREHPDAKIVVTGCMVEKNKEELEALEAVDLVLSNHDKDLISDVLTQGCSSPIIQDEEAFRKKKRTFTPLKISTTKGRGRAFVKIQDGCNHACSFCKVVMVRGRSRSRPLQDVVEEVNRLVGSGYKEVVLAGIQLGAYGDDLGFDEGVSRVVDQISEVSGLERIRLSSIEPTDVSDQLIETLASNPKCCEHMHIPLQSGDTEVLKGMNRRYESSLYGDLIAKLKAKMPEFALTLDVMVGFPNETPERYQNTLDLLGSLGLLRCHVFPYSRREGTRAASFEDLDPRIIKERVQDLMAHSDRWGASFRRPYLGRTMKVLVEQETGQGRLLQGLTHNYLKVCFQGDANLVGEMVDVELLDLEGEVFLGRALKEVACA